MTRIEKALELFGKGFTTMTDKKRCLELVSRTYEEERHTISNGLLDLRNSHQMKEDADFDALYYGMPYDLHQYRPKHSAMYSTLFPESVKTIESLVTLRNTIKDAPIVAKVSAKQVFEQKVKELSKSNKIELAVMPLKVAAIERAEKEAKELVERCKAKLVEGGFDLKVVAPYPKSNINRNAYSAAMGKRALFCAITKHVKSSWRMDQDKEIVEVCPVYVARFIESAKTDAAEQYDAFVAKLIVKIGQVTEATLKGNHVWSFSILTITKADGTVENWKTQMIINVSKLGKLFNQWPTRKVK